MRPELEVLQSIYPELSLNGSHASIDIPVSFEVAQTVAFDTLGSLEVTYLPSISLSFELPDEYPDSAAPKIYLSSDWLGQERIATLVQDCQGLWSSGEEVMYLIVDYLHTSAATGFGSFNSDTSPGLVLSDKFRSSLLLYQQFAARIAFEQHSYACEICLDWRSGRDCIQLCENRHIFCKDCLRDMFSLHIREGSVSSVLCPSCPSLGITELETGKVAHKFSEGTLLQIISAAEYERYVILVRKQELEALPTSIHCPRDFCATILPRDPDEKLVVCTKCELAFCAECKRTWHGPREPCKRTVYSSDLGQRYKALLGDSTKADEKRLMERLHGKKTLEKLLRDIADEELAEQWRLEHAKACPACGTYIEKAYGCNHLQCGICAVHFCFLCGDYLAANNPYPHYSDKEGTCYGKLFEGLTGLEDPMGGLVV